MTANMLCGSYDDAMEEIDKTDGRMDGERQIDLTNTGTQTHRNTETRTCGHGLTDRQMGGQTDSRMEVQMVR